MFEMSQTWADLFGLAGLLNPVALAIGAGMGWFSDQKAKILVAGFAAAALSLLLEAAWGLLGLPSILPHDAAPLAVFPFRFVGGIFVAALAMLISRRK